jgi:hypothetical protein
VQLNDLLINPIKVWKREILFLVGFSFILGILQLYFLQFGFNNLGIIGYIYLTNFVNIDWEHFFYNLFVMWFGLLFVFVLTPEKQKKRFWLNLLFILFISPVIMFILNTLFITLTTGKTTIGYSGIATVFLGYGFLSLSMFLHIAWKNNLLKRKLGKFQFFTIIGILLAFPLFTFIFFADPIEITLILTYGIVDGIYQTFLQAKINIFIHVIGYLLGLVFPIISQKIIST